MNPLSMDSFMVIHTTQTPANRKMLKTFSLTLLEKKELVCFLMFSQKSLWFSLRLWKKQEERVIELIFTNVLLRQTLQRTSALKCK